MQPAGVRVQVGCRFLAARRLGKLLLLDTGTGEGRPAPVLGLRFRMSGRLVVDGPAAGTDLRPSDDPLAQYARFGVVFSGGGHLAVRDPVAWVGWSSTRPRTGSATMPPTSPKRQLAQALAHSRAPLKARILDQGHLAGIGNLIADEVLW